MKRWALRLAGLALVISVGACMRASGTSDVRFHDGPPADSVTVALWRMDETGDTRVRDVSPFRLEGIAGPETSTDFGRFNGARRFRQSLDSFVLIPSNPLFNFKGSFTIEAWIYPDDYGWYEATPIVSKWTPLANEQSWSTRDQTGYLKIPNAKSLPSWQRPRGPLWPPYSKLPGSDRIHVTSLVKASWKILRRLFGKTMPSWSSPLQR